VKPIVGDVVHYVSYGTPGGEYTSQCRAAVVTEVHREDVVSLAVLNPTGMYFIQRLELGDPMPRALGGTWHWPERVESPGEPR
jgi:hypothetical protein